MAEYGRFIRAALGKTRVRECVPSLDEIVVLIQRQDMLCTVHCPGTSACTVAISSHTTAEEVSGGWEVAPRPLAWGRCPGVMGCWGPSMEGRLPIGGRLEPQCPGWGTRVKP